MNSVTAAQTAIDLRSEISHLRDICGEEDSELLSDMIEGETQVDTFLGKVLDMVQTDEADVAGIKLYQNKLVERRRRLESRSQRLRTLLATVVAELPGRKFRHPLALVTAFDVDPRVIIQDESAIPSAYWLPQDPKLNEPAIRRQLLERSRALAEVAALENPEARSARHREIERELPDIPGASLGNGEISVRIRGA